jgi:hypothetical protein
MALLQLPSEVLGIVCEHLPRHDLRSLRLACRCLLTVSTRVLFRNLFVSFNMDSLERLEDVSYHETLSAFVESIHFNMSVIENPGLWNFDRWIQHSAGRNIGLYPGQKEGFLEQFNRYELKEYHRNYLEHVCGLKRLLRPHALTRKLSASMEKLPNLRNLRCSGVMAARPKQQLALNSYGLLSLDHLSQTAREILQEPIYCHERSLYLFWTLLNAAFTSDQKPLVTSLHGSTLDLRRWALNGYPLNNLPIALHKLRDLSLEFFEESRMFVDIRGVSKFLCQIPEIQTLRLSFGSFTTNALHQKVELDSIFDSQQCWKNLRKLSLQGILAYSVSLRRLLLAHKATLRALELSYFQFHSDYPDGGKPSSDDTWFGFFCFLPAELCLSHARFDGYLHSLYESWLTRDSNLSEPYHDDCVKYQIERFVTRRGPCPFTLLSTKPISTKGNLWNITPFPWLYLEDNSWLCPLGTFNMS